MREEILKAIKTGYLKYGLKADSIDKLATLLEAHVAATGSTPETLQATIDSAVKLFEPTVAIIQSEVDSRVQKKPAAADPAPDPAPTPVEKMMKDMQAKLELLEKEKELQAKSSAKKSLIDQAYELSTQGGATKKSLLNAALKLVEITEGMTADKISELALAEYNKLQADISGVGYVPTIPSRTLSDAEIEKTRQEAIDKSAAEFQKNAYI